MYTSWISDVLHIRPSMPQHWLELLFLALAVLVVMELHKALRLWRAARSDACVQLSLIFFQRGCKQPKNTGMADHDKGMLGSAPTRVRR
jgi:hypothetical protein